MPSTKKPARTLPVIQMPVDAAYDSRPAFGDRLTARVGRSAKSRLQRVLRFLIGAVGFLTRTAADGPVLTAEIGRAHV